MIFKKISWQPFVLSACLGFTSINSDNLAINRVLSHLLIGDPRSAADVAADALQSDPDNRDLHHAYIKALAKGGDEKEMGTAFSRYCTRFKFDPETDRELIQDIAWGIISAGEHSDSPIVRLCSLIAAFHGQEAKSVEHLRRGCFDSNSAIRGAAVQLACRFRDAPLCNEMLRLFREEKNWRVRLEVIKAIGKMKIQKGSEALLSLVGNSQSSAEEKAVAIKSLVNLLEAIGRDEIVRMASSERAGIRLLTCEVIAHLQNERDTDLLWRLAFDSNYEVRAAALRSFGLLGIREYSGHSVADLARERCQDLSRSVSMTAAWLLTIQEPGSAKPVFDFWLTHEIAEARQEAAAALAATGSYGILQMQNGFQETKDPCVKINLALGLIQQRVDVSKACDLLFQEFTLENRRWRWDENGIFSGIVPLKNSSMDDLETSNEEIFQMTRLEILNLLAVLKYPKVEQAIQSFLEQKIWGISGLASAVLLTEGNAEALDSIEKILEKSSQGIKVQAALILALWGGAEKAIQVLEQSYSAADRQTKEKILGGIGNIGSLRSLPFLVERLQDPQQTLRLFAASAILQCLNH